MDKPTVVKYNDNILIVDENAAVIALESRLRHGLVVDWRAAFAMD